MTDRYENIRKALADMDAAAEARNGIAWRDAHARFVVHVPPDTIRELLAERDALEAENERLRAEVVQLISMRADAIYECTLANIRADKLTEALREAREMVEDWAGYAGEYFQNKHDLQGDLAKLDAALREQEEGHEQ